MQRGTLRVQANAETVRRSHLDVCLVLRLDLRVEECRP